MAPPVAKATIQSCIISLGSCLIALYLTPDRPPHIFSLILYAALSTPPNFWWQQFLERKFPGYPVNKIKVDDGGKGAEVEKKLDIRNTVTKVILDQTVASLVNVIAFIGGTRLLRGVPLDLCWLAIREQTVPIMLAGYKLWPAVNVIQHTMVPVDQKTVVGSLVGLGWGTYLALRSG